jgi:hypothetical protein
MRRAWKNFGRYSGEPWLGEIACSGGEMTDWRQ